LFHLHKDIAIGIRIESAIFIYASNLHHQLRSASSVHCPHQAAGACCKVTASSGTAQSLTRPDPLEIKRGASSENQVSYSLFKKIIAIMTLHERSPHGKWKYRSKYVLQRCLSNIVFLCSP
jgi:hypothetical protein